MKRVLLVSLLACFGACQTSPEHRRTGIRAVWVTRWDYVTAPDIVEIFSNCQRAGFNTVLFQVRGNGTAFYRSTFEPWAEELGGVDPGFDPLEVALDEGQKRGMEVHAWVNVMPAWRGPDEPKDRTQLYHARPDWFWYDANGVRQPLIHRVGDRTRAWYVSLNPCLPEVRGYLVSVFREIVTNYAVDGLHLDYIRFPNEPVVPGEKIPDYPRDPRTLELFAQETGASPDSDPDKWNAWRTAKVTQLVTEIHAMLREERPAAVLSAAVGTNRDSSLKHHRDGPDWVRRGIVDVVYPMNYKRDLASFEQGLSMWLPGGEAVLVPGLWIDRRLSTAAGIEVAQQQIRAALDATGNFCLFAYHSMFDARSHAKQGATARARGAAQREERRRELLPFLNDLR